MRAPRLSRFLVAVSIAAAATVASAAEQGEMPMQGMMGHHGGAGATQQGMMGCPMMSGGMGAGSMGGMMGGARGGMMAGRSMPAFPPGNEKLQMQMQAEIMQKVGEIMAKYAERIPSR